MELAFVHVLVFCVTLIFIFRADHDGFLYLCGRIQVLDEARVRLHHRVVWVGLVVMIATGVLLMRPLWDFYITDPIFIAKMVFVLGLVINGFFIGSLSRVATEKPFQTLTTSEKIPLFISGMVSITCWMGAFVIGFFFL